jgi:hypothetical protein
MAIGFQVTFDCSNPDKLAHFWAEALHYKIPNPPPGFNTWHEFLKARNIPESEWDSKSAIEDPEGKGSRIFFQKVPEPKIVKNRVHLDLNVSGGFSAPLQDRIDRVKAETARLIMHGAKLQREMQIHDEYWIVLTDPEGNEFCVH